MEKKYIKVPFDVEMAKRISNGEVDGKIITRDGRNVRVVCWDARGDLCILALLEGKSKDDVGAYPNDGRIFMEGESPVDLMLEVPEYMTFKDGDVIAYDSFDTISITMADITCEGKNFFAHYYVELRNGELKFNDVNVRDILSVGARLANESEKQQLIGVLKASKEPKAEEYLKRFFGIEKKKKYEFKPKDWVLCRSGDEWCLCRFSHKTMRFDGVLMFVTVGGIAYEQCIPYNEQTAHLIGKTDDWKEIV